MTATDFAYALACLGPIGLTVGIAIGYRFPALAPRLLGRKHTP